MNYTITKIKHGTRQFPHGPSLQVKVTGLPEIPKRCQLVNLRTGGLYPTYVVIGAWKILLRVRTGTMPTFGHVNHATRTVRIFEGCTLVMAERTWDTLKPILDSMSHYDDAQPLFNDLLLLI